MGKGGLGNYLREDGKSMTSCCTRCTPGLVTVWDDCHSALLIHLVAHHIPHDMVRQLADDRWDDVAVESAGDWRRRYLSPARRLKL